MARLTLKPPPSARVGAGPRACPSACPAVDRPETGPPQRVAPTLSLTDLVHRFKTMTTK